jgi:hypothetical protein
MMKQLPLPGYRGMASRSPPSAHHSWHPELATYANPTPRTPKELFGKRAYGNRRSCRITKWRVFARILATHRRARRSRTSLNICPSHGYFVCARRKHAGYFLYIPCIWRAIAVGLIRALPTVCPVFIDLQGNFRGFLVDGGPWAIWAVPPILMRIKLK